MENIECLIVSESYGDVLQYTLPISKKIVSNILVVTSERDYETQELCQENNVRRIITNKFFESKTSPFDKESALNEGLRHLQKIDWILSIDSDVVLPADLLQKLDAINLDPETIYGCNRRFCENKVNWEKNQTFTDYPLEIGTKPGGFFQLFHSSCKALRRLDPFTEGYDVKLKEGYDNPDGFFVDQFKHCLRLKEFEVMHLGHYGPQNWKGRVTPRW